MSRFPVPFHTPPRQWRIRRPGFLLLLLLCLPGISLQADWVPYDVFPTGTKGLGVGGAFTSLADDGGAIYFNPAGLFQLPKPLLTYQLYSILKMPNLIDTRLQVKWEYFPLLAYAVPLEQGRTAAALYVRTLFKSMVETYSVHGVGGGFSWRVAEDLALGVNLGLAIGSQQENYSFGFFWQLGLLARLSPLLKLGIIFRAPIALAWYSLRGDLDVEETLPWSLQGGISWRFSRNMILSFELEYQSLDNVRYTVGGVDRSPALEGGLFRTIHPHLGFQFLHVPSGAQIRVGLMTMAAASSSELDPQPILCLGIGAWASRVFKIDFSLMDSLLFDIFTRTDRFERFMLSFEYSL